MCPKDVFAALNNNPHAEHMHLKTGFHATKVRALARYLRASWSARPMNERADKPDHYNGNSRQARRSFSLETVICLSGMWQFRGANLGDLATTAGATQATVGNHLTHLNMVILDVLGGEIAFPSRAECEAAVARNPSGLFAFLDSSALPIRACEHNEWMTVRNDKGRFRHLLATVSSRESHQQPLVLSCRVGDFGRTNDLQVARYGQMGGPGVGVDGGFPSFSNDGRGLIPPGGVICSTEAQRSARVEVEHFFGTLKGNSSGPASKIWRSQNLLAHSEHVYVGCILHNWLTRHRDDVMAPPCESHQQAPNYPVNGGSSYLDFPF
jgi:hypothetical protein